MRNSFALLGIPDLPIDAFRHVGDRKICPQGGVSSVVESVSDTVSNAVSSVSDALATVDDTVNSVVPGGWATVTSIAVPVAAPYIQAANVLDKGGTPEDVLKNYAFSQIGGEVGGQVAGETGSALAGKVAGGTTAGLLSGATPEQALTGGALNAVSPTGLLSQATSALTPTADTTPTTPTTGATNMADISQIYDYGNVPTDITGGQGTFDTGTAPYTQAQIDAMTPQTYTGTGVNPQLDSIIKSMLAAGGSAAQTAQNFLAQNPKLLSGGLGLGANLIQSQADKDAAIQAQARIAQATQQGVAGAQFRPVGTTTRFGTSQFNIDPATGQLISAGYTASPEITSAQTQLMNLGSSYLAQTPEEVAQQYLSKQYELLDPSRQRQLASIRNQAFQTGRGGLSVGSTGLRPSGAQGLMGSNPELEAYYNALAQQDAQLAAGAQQAGQQQVTYGAGLFGQAGQLENLAQQPFALSQGLATQSSLSGARAGQLGIQGNVYGNAIGLSAARNTNPLATVVGGLSDPTSLLAQGLGTYFGSTAPATGGITSQGMNAPTVDAYGNYVPLGYANY
jgi:hypothetical protein